MASGMATMATISTAVKSRSTTNCQAFVRRSSYRPSIGLRKSLSRSHIGIDPFPGDCGSGGSGGGLNGRGVQQPGRGRDGQRLVVNRQREELADTGVVGEHLAGLDLVDPAVDLQPAGGQAGGDGGVGTQVLDLD